MAKHIFCCKGREMNKQETLSPLPTCISPHVRGRERGKAPCSGKRLRAQAAPLPSPNRRRFGCRRDRSARKRRFLLGRPAGREEKSEPGGEPRARSPIYSFRTANVFSDLTGTWDPRSPGAAAAPRLEKKSLLKQNFTQKE